MEQSLELLIYVSVPILFLAVSLSVGLRAIARALEDKNDTE